MKLEIDIPKLQYNNIIALDSIILGRVPYKGIIMNAINAIKQGKALEQETKIKVLNRDEALRKLGAVDIYQASAWITLLDDLEYLGLKICEVEDGNDD